MDENLTEDQVREYLAGRGYADEAGRVLDEARRFPGRYAYTADRYAWAVRHMPSGHWRAGDSTATERRIAAKRTAGPHGWRWIA